MFDAHITEIDGPHYPIKLWAVPRVGETIKLNSFIEQAANKPSVKDYEVVRIEHEVHDISDKVRQSKEGFHFVTIFVKPIEGNTN